MEPAVLAFVLWIFGFLSVPAAGYPNGKVREACSSMMPSHGHSPQPSPEHTISVNETKFRPGNHIKVSLSGPVFEGFFIQARNAENLAGPAVGSFMLGEERISQLLTCGLVKNSAVSHTSKSKKTNVEAYWVAPTDVPEHVQFLATVVEKYKIFWVKIPGPIISQPNAPPLTTPTSITPESLPTSQPVFHLTTSFNASSCGITKFCIRNPPKCNPGAAYCFFLSFKQSNYSVLIEMSGPSEGYIAFALSHDQWMGDDDAYLCINEDHRININTAYLSGRTPPVLDSENGLEDLSWRVADGLLQCSFRRNLHLPAYKGRFNLDANYYIFLADGEASEGGLIHKHHRQPLITNGMYNVTDSPKDVGGSRSPLLLKLHASLMFVAWMTTVSIGVIVARFFKPVWPHSLFGKEIWFQVHRMLMLTTVLLTSIAFVLPFIYRGGWSEWAGFHPYLGCTVMALAIFQPLMAGFRPPPHSPRRQVFNWIHWSTGTTARILAVVTMFLGMDLPALNLPDPWDTYTMIGFVAWHVSIDILLEIHSYCLIRKVEVIDEDRIQILQSLTSAEAEGHTFKEIVLTIYICGNIAFLLTFLAAIHQL
ncbi:ferric-chelate reductase 1 isoform X2 [Chelonoidis abingdonii]|uniref:Ferric chelate reductase 1 n=1 Tax=Chelonoidis abingdonii TaxID=106734 RepID=A0A8C0GQJ8_CHEAB|nr:putative ferric-chelate reductase 1 isoform X1 [Chelonoidis abingdonii]XP_032660849.1 putative ferric-chelate reductase 1 isoform X1 [Chelonoidis abingdonii]XP_032660850.1 putative ferric-chelate reductase 1 isoform X1 [Chelonoidis abingdonii]XP_032660851.1 putative ferric-chelate reductase 1 isoform X1 [Chelonoidis abingdonii]XP_032660852.1 putative ferric-chelate reductase 1 isoform X1 [Chelonoidis abingdonii]